MFISSLLVVVFTCLLNLNVAMYIRNEMAVFHIACYNALLWGHDITNNQVLLATG